MSSATLILPKDFDASKLDFSGGVKKSKSPAISFLNLKYDGARLCIQTPKMFAPFGISNSAIMFGGNDNWSLMLSMGEDTESKSNNQRITDLRKCIESMNKAVTKYIEKNASEVFPKKKVPKEVIRNNCKSPIKEASSSEYSDNLKVSIPHDDKTGKARDTVSFYKRKKGKDLPMPWEEATDIGRAKVICMININAVWIRSSDGAYGLSVKLVKMFQLESGTSMSKLKPVTYSSDEEEEEEEEEVAEDEEVDEIADELEDGVGIED